MEADPRRIIGATRAWPLSTSPRRAYSGNPVKVRLGKMSPDGKNVDADDTVSASGAKENLSSVRAIPRPGIQPRNPRAKPILFCVTNKTNDPSPTTIPLLTG